MDSDKLVDLLDSEGMEEEEFLSEYGFSSVVPGICTNPGCSYVTNVEPDQTKGWCEFCDTQTVCSGLVLAGVI